MEIKDIAGLSEPIKKLIEVTATGIGGAAKPILTALNVMADSYKIKKISKAIQDSQESLKIEYKSDNLVITLDENQVALRAQERVGYQELKRQQNTEKVVLIAANDLEFDEDISGGKVDEDWITKFFSQAQDVTNEDMQFIWGKILAGEVRRPGSFSMRTLDVLRNIKYSEAKTFEKFAHLRINVDDTWFIPDDTDYLWDTHKITFDDQLIMEEAGLIKRKLGYTMYESKEPVQATFRHGNYIVEVEKKANTPKFGFNIHSFTTSGRELLALIELTPNRDYVKNFASIFRNDNVSVVIKNLNVVK